MKLRSILLVASAAFLLTACGGDNTETVPSNGLSITLAGDTTVEVGRRIKLNATVNNDGQRLGVTWESSSPSIASVDGEGYITGLAEGEATITATSIADSEVTSTWQIVVLPSSIPSVAIGLNSTSITVGGSVTLSANIYNPTTENPTIRWTSERGKGNIAGARTDTATFTTAQVGNEIINLEVNIGPYTMKKSINLYIADNYADPAKAWTSIDSVEAFTSTFLAGGSVDGNYYLDADIDLGGLTVTQAMSPTITGTLDGRGHRIYNYSVEGAYSAEDGTSANASLFESVAASGAIRNLAVSGTMGEDASGWGSTAFVGGLSGTVENVLVETEHSFDSGVFANEANNYYVPFNGGITGTLEGTGKIFDAVVNVTGEGVATVYADVAYPVGVGTSQTFEINGFYTNSTVVGGGVGTDQYGQWGGPVTDMTGYTTGINWANSEANEYYSLSTAIWNVSDGAMPTLKVI